VQQTFVVKLVAGNPGLHRRLDVVGSDDVELEDGGAAVGERVAVLQVLPL